MIRLTLDNSSLYLSHISERDKVISQSLAFETKFGSHALLRPATLDETGDLDLLSRPAQLNVLADQHS
jgi:hypothetical protein